MIDGIFVMFWIVVGLFLAAIAGGDRFDWVFELIVKYGMILIIVLLVFMLAIPGFPKV